MYRRRRAVQALEVLLVLTGACSLDLMASKQTEVSAELEAVLADFDRVQESIRTLEAEFTETVQSALLREPVIGKGVVYFTKPDSVRWEYSVPEEMRFVIANDEYTGYFPGRKRVERRNIHRWRERLFRVLGLGQASNDLLQIYDITLGESGDGAEEPILLVLNPKKRRVRKRIAVVRIWVDASSYLPVRVEYLGKNGNQRTIVFHRMTVNPDLTASLYKLELPADVEVRKGFSGLAGLGSEGSE